MNWRRGIRRLWIVLWLLGCGVVAFEAQVLLEPRPFWPLVPMPHSGEPPLHECESYEDRALADTNADGQIDERDLFNPETWRMFNDLECRVKVSISLKAREDWRAERDRNGIPAFREGAYWANVGLLVGALSLWSAAAWGPFYIVAWIARGFAPISNNL